MKKMKIGILVLVAVLALVSVASADTVTGTIVPTSQWFGVTLPDGTHDLLCAEEAVHIYYSTYLFTIYDSRTSFPPANPPNPAFDQTKWNKVNFIVNQGSPVTWHEMQAAIWYVMQTPPPPTSWDPQINPVNEAVLADLIDAANTPAAANFVPGPGQQYAVILSASGYQCVFYLEQIPTNAPEFPTLALPVGMLIGVIGAVYVTKGREK